MDKRTEFMSVNQIEIPTTDRKKYADFCISGVTGGYVPMPGALKQPMVDAIRAYAERIPVVIRDEERGVLLHGENELEQIAKADTPTAAFVMHVPQDVWNDEDSEAPEFLEAVRQIIYLGIGDNPRWRLN